MHLAEQLHGAPEVIGEPNQERQGRQAVLDRDFKLAQFGGEDGLCGEQTTVNRATAARGECSHESGSPRRKCCAVAHVHH